MEKGQTVMTNSIDELFQKTESKESSAVILDEEKPSTYQKKKSSKKQRITVQISEDVIERVKNAVYWTPGLTLASLAEEAFSTAVNKLEEEREASFPKRKEELKTGRPIS
ncbi:hypothetical protein [Candidatus Protochlamydia phocaeensis]|uniref:hypothetical protein n=1 Tax=Candidatus Protochlamydia phocaeensis TaxID=1414722 RepID=UPI000838E351|nr:hypothetical protein [Candidatus Protochlamydia phocaeensis]